MLVSAPSDLSVAIPAVEQVRFPYAYVNTFSPSVKLMAAIFWNTTMTNHDNGSTLPQYATSISTTSVDHRGPWTAWAGPEAFTKTSVKRSIVK